MKVRKLVNSILTFGMVLILFIILPVGENTAYAGNVLEAKLNITSQKVVKGKTFNLRVYNLKANQSVVFSSSRPGVATVDTNGVITGIENGTAIITAKIYETGKLLSTLSCSITVGPPAVAIMISKLSLELTVGDQARLSYIVFPITTAETPVYLSNDESVVSITPGGRVFGEAPGLTHVFCMISKGVYATCEVTVLPQAEPAEDDKEAAETVVTTGESTVEVPVVEEGKEESKDDKAAN